MARYGRSDEEWAALEEAGWDFLVSRARLGRPTSYTEMNAALTQRTGLRMFDFELSSERAAMGELLGRLADRSLAEANLMISALVNYLYANDAGSGFYQLAKQKGLLRAGASDAEKTDFWIDQMTASFQHAW